MATRWTTYRELADLWGLNVEAAQARVRRAGWHRTPGNDGTVRIEVPDEVFEAPRVAPPTKAADVPPTPSALEDPTVKALVAELQGRAERAEALAAELQGRLQQALDVAQALDTLRQEQAAALARLERQARRGRWR